MALWDIYKRRPGLVLGFHGCDEETGEVILSGDIGLKKSENSYDWDDRRIRSLDCAVIRTTHGVRASEGLRPYDTVRGAFWEGGSLYPEAIFSTNQHIQIVVVDPVSVLGYFRPL